METNTLMTGLYVFVLAAFIGYMVISRVPPLLHTPLMSATNAISAISVVGALLAAGSEHNTLSTVLGVLCSLPAARRAPTTEIAEMALVADMSGVCKSGGTREMTM